MDLDIKQNGSICVLKAKGRFVSGEPVAQFENAFHSALDGGHILLVLDLEAVPYIDSSGIGSVVNALRMSTKLGGQRQARKPLPLRLKDIQNGRNPCPCSPSMRRRTKP